MNKKKGCLLLMLVLFLVVIANVNAVQVNTNTYWAWYAQCYNCDTKDIDISCSEVEVSIGGDNTVACLFLDEGDRIPENRDGKIILSAHGTECHDWATSGNKIDIGVKESNLVNYEIDGCYAIAEEGIREFGDACGWKIVATGFHFSSSEYNPLPNVYGGSDTPFNYKLTPDSYLPGGNIFLAGGASDGWHKGAVIMLNFKTDPASSFGFDTEEYTPGISWRLDSPSEYVCADDFYWHGCEKEDDLNTMVWGDNKLFVCQPKDDIPSYYEWVEKGVDQDHDSYIASSPDPNIPIDCADNPSAEGLRTEGCPETPDECQYPRDSKCAICINPSSPEICDDGINNDCRGNGREFGAAVNELEGATPDSCDRFKQGCEARGDNSLMDGEEYIDEEGERVSFDDSVDERLPRAYGNTRGQQFSWTNTPEGGSCCGYNGITDLGNLNNDQSKICLKDDNELVGVDVPSTEDPDTYTVKDAVTWNEDACQGDWCWVPASGNAGGKILTMKKLGTPAYDVVSNEHQWYSCNEQSFLGDLATGATSEPTQKLMNRFACYQEGDHWSWAECTLDDFRNPSVKARHGGDALYSLYLGPNGERAGGSVHIKADAGPGEDDGGFGHIYERSTANEAYFDFTGYDTLEFFFKFWEGGTEDGVPIPPDRLRLPVGLTLTLYGPDEQEYFSQNVLGNIVNRPLLSANQFQWNHVQVKIPANLQLVSGIAERM